MLTLNQPNGEMFRILLPPPGNGMRDEVSVNLK